MTVVTNFKSGRAPSTPRLSFYSFIMIVVDLQRWLWCKNIDETFVTLQNLFHTPRDIFLRIYIKSKIRLCNRCRLLCNVFKREEWLKVSCFVLHWLVIDLATYFFNSPLLWTNYKIDFLCSLWCIWHFYSVCSLPNAFYVVTGWAALSLLHSDTWPISFKWLCHFFW